MNTENKLTPYAATCAAFSAVADAVSELKTALRQAGLLIHP